MKKYKLFIKMLDSKSIFSLDNPVIQHSVQRELRKSIRKIEELLSGKVRILCIRIDRISQMELGDDLLGVLHFLISERDRLLGTTDFDYSKGGTYLHDLLYDIYHIEYDNYFDTLELGASQKRANSGLVDLLWGLHFSKLESSVDALMKEIEKGITISRKMNQSKKIKASAGTVVTSRAVAYPIERGTPGILPKIGKFQERCERIMSGKITYAHLDELKRMGDALDKLSVKIDATDNQLVSIISELQERISELLGAGIDDVDTIQKTTNGKLDNVIPPVELVEYPGNIKFIEYIRFMRSGAITYKSSSLKGGESVGDGNFIAHVWRQFLAQLEMLAQRNVVDFGNFSWREVVQYIYLHHDGIRTRRVRLATFLDIMSDYDKRGDWIDNWDSIIESVMKYSKQDGLFQGAGGIVPLSNFLEKLEQNPPPSR